MSTREGAPGSNYLTVDRVVCVVLLVATLVEGGFAFLFAGFFAMASDVCGPDTECDTTPISVGIMIVQAGTIAVWVSALVLSVRAWSQRRLSFYWPLIAGLAIPALFLLGGAIASRTAA